MVAYVGDGVFEEVWIGVEDKLPRLIHAVYLSDPDQLRHDLMLSNWQIDVPVPADAFAPSAAATAKRIQFANPNPPPPPSARTPAKANQPRRRNEGGRTHHEKDRLQFAKHRDYVPSARNGFCLWARKPLRRKHVA